MLWLSHYSYLVVAVAVLIVAFWFLRRYGIAGWLPRLGILAMLAVLLLAVPLALRRDPSDVERMRDLEAVLGRGQPVLLEYYSDWSIGSLLTRPAIEGAARGLGASAAVVQLSASDPEQRAVAEELGLRVTPSYVAFDAGGRRVGELPGRIDAATLRGLLERD